MPEIDQISSSIGALTSSVSALQREMHNGFLAVNNQISQMRDERALDISRICDKMLELEKTTHLQGQDIADAKTTIRTIKQLFIGLFALLSAYIAFTEAFRITSINHNTHQVAGDD